MGETIEAKECILGKLFSTEFLFEIPLYQRPFSWSTENFEQLFDDIYEAFSGSSKQYFLGSIILQESAGKKDTFEVVDGQQRLTALALFLAVVRDLTAEELLRKTLEESLFQEANPYKSIPRQVRITPWEALRDTFNKYLYKRGGSSDFKKEFEGGRIKFTDQEDSLYHLYEAVSVFTRRYGELLIDPSILGRFITFLMGDVYVVYIQTSEFISAFRMFTVLNTRGISLSIADLLKSENLGAITDLGERIRAARNWQAIEDDLGREALEKVVIFIRTIQVKDKSRLGIYDEYQSLIFRPKLLDRGGAFIGYVTEVADIHSEKILNPIVHLDAAEKNEYRALVQMLTRFIPFDDWIPPTIAFHQKFKDDAKLSAFVIELEKKVFVEWAVGLSLTERIGSLNQVIKIIAGTASPEDVVSQTKGWKEPEKLREIMIRVLSDPQFYYIFGGKLARYFLLRLDLDQWEMENFGGYSGTITVEHVLPQTPQEESEWKKSFDDKSRAELTNAVGNLVLLSGRKNSSARNYEFAKKKEAYFRGRSTAFRITRELESVDSWSPTEVAKRQALLISRAESIYFS